MSKENLFSLLKREELIVWAGAGMSRYAGFPDGNALRDLIISDLGPGAQDQISPTTPLMDTAEAYKNIKGGSRRDLVALLNKVFRAKPKATTAHDQLRLIPHVKTIVTTNYDQLFEQAYGDSAQSFYKTSQITQMDRNFIQIFKAHGDLSDPDSLIITSSDYRKFLERDLEQSSFWTVIKERLVSNSVLFIGYGLEDLNTGMIIGRILEELQENRREYFFVAPGLPNYKINDLIRRGIHYIDSTAENIISEMLSYLRDNILAPASDGSRPGNPATIANFLGKFNIGLTTQSNGTSNQIKSIYPLDPDTIGTLKITVKADSEIDRSIQEFMCRPSSNLIDFGSKDVNGLEFRLGGIRIPVDAKSFKIGAVPNIDEKVFVRFDNGFEYPDLPLKVFGGGGRVEVHAMLRGADLKITLFPFKEGEKEIQSDLTYTHHKSVRRVREEIELFTFLLNLLGGLQFKVFTSKDTISSGARKISNLDQKDFQWYLEFFEALKLVEAQFSVLFTDFPFGEIDGKSAKLLNRALARVSKLKVQETWDKILEVRAPNHQLRSSDLAAIASGKSQQVTIRGDYIETIDLLGQKLTMGFPCLEILAPRITNLKEFKKDNSITPKIVSSTKQCNIYYRDTYEGPAPEDVGRLVIFEASIAD